MMRDKIFFMFFAPFDAGRLVKYEVRSTKDRRNAATETSLSALHTWNGQGPFTT